MKFREKLGYDPQMEWYLFSIVLQYVSHKKAVKL